MQRISFLFLLSLLICSCSTQRQLQIVDRIQHDTLYNNKVSYDTIYIKDKSVEYRYKLLRDTVRRVRVDSVPVIREIEVVKEVKYIPWYAKALSTLGLLTITVLILRLCR